MKLKRIMAMVLCFAMVLSTMSFNVFAEEPDTSGDIINVDASNAQDVLDGKYGDITGKTINFTENITSVLDLARTTKYAGSKTEYLAYNGDGTYATDKVLITDETDTTGIKAASKYYRTLSNVTFTADEDVTVAGFAFSAEHAVGPCQDYVRDTYVDAGDAYYDYRSLENITFKGLTITGHFDAKLYMEDSAVGNVTFDGCVFTGTTDDGANAAIKFLADNQYFTNVAVKNCSIDGYFQGVYIQGVDGADVSNNAISNTEHNAIALQSCDGDNPAKGTVVVKENYITNVSNRTIRMNYVGDANIAINNNIMVNCGNSAGELIAAESVDDAADVNLEANYWDGKDVSTAVSGFTAPTTVGVTGGTWNIDIADYVADGFELDEDGNVVESAPAVTYVAYIGEEGYETLAAAVADAENGATIVLMNGEYELPLFSGKELTFKGESKDGVIVNDAPAATQQGWSGSTFHFENLTAKGINANYYGLANGVVAVTYKDCVVNNQRFLYATTVSFENCTFNQTSPDWYNVWTYGAQNVTFTGCTFNCAGKSVLVFHDTPPAGTDGITTNLTVNDCDFVATQAVTGKAAIEIDTSSMAGASITVDELTTVNETFAGGSVSGSKLWNDKKADASNTNGGGTSSVVVVAGETVKAAAVEAPDTTYVAQIDDVKYESFADALDEVQNGDTITLISGDTVISMAGSVDSGKTVTITGTAIVDWTQGNLMIGRGGEGDGKVIFDGANITSSVKKNPASTGIHVSGSKGSDANTNNGVLVIRNSTIELDYLINRNETIIENNSTLTVYGGCWTHGRDASESGTGTDATATLTIEAGSTVTVVNENGMGVGGEGIGVMTVKGTYNANVLNVSAKGTVNVEGGTVKIDGTATNNGTVTVSGTSTLNIPALAEGSNRIKTASSATLKDTNIGGGITMLGDLTIDGGLTLTGGLWASAGGKLSGDTVTASYAMFQTGTYTISAPMELVYGYLSYGGSFTVTSTIHSTGTNGEPLWINGDVTLEAGALLDSDGGLWLSNENTVVTVKEGAKIDASTINLSDANAKLNIGGTVVAAKLVNSGTITLTNESATLTAPEGLTVTTDVKDYEVEYADGTYQLIAKDYIAKIGENKYETLSAAITDAQAEDTIELLADATENITIENGATVMIDLSDKTLFGYIAPCDPASLTISNGSIVNTNTSYSGIEINSGSLNLENVNIDSARHAVRIDGEVTATINSGEYKLNATSGTRHAVNVSGAANVTIKDGTFVGPKGTTMDSGSAVCVQEGAAVTIEGGNFSGGKRDTLGVSGTLTVYGGTYDQDPTAYLANGYTAIKELTNGNYVVGETPTATVNNLGAMTIPSGEYESLGGGSTSEDMELNFVMQFLANQDAEDMKTSPYAEWYGDFVITFTGIENGSFTADNCYLAGYYGEVGWVKVPVDGMVVENGVRYPVMLGSGAGQKYDYICESVKDFRCAMFLTPEILAANPNLKVNLELSVVDNSAGSDAATEALMKGTEGTFYKTGSTEYTVTDFTKPVAQIGDITYTSLAGAVESAQNGETITLILDVEMTEPVTISGKELTLDLGTYNICDKVDTGVLTSNTAEVCGLITLKDGAKLTIEGEGTIECNYTNVPDTKSWTGMAYCVDVDATSELTVNGGSFVNGNGGIQTQGKVTVNDGTFIPHNGGVGIMALYQNADVTVNDGTFKETVEESDVYTGSGAVWSGFGATVVINGGTYDFAADPEHNNVVWTLFPAQHAIAGVTGDINMTVNGGTFVNFNPATDTVVDWSEADGFTVGSVVSAGFQAASISEGVYTVVKAAEGKTAFVLREAEGDYIVEIPTVDIAGKNATVTLAKGEAEPYYGFSPAAVLSVEAKDGEGKDIYTGNETAKNITVTIPYKKEIENQGSIVVLHDGEPVSFKYDEETGIITVEVAHFSDIAVYEVSYTATIKVDKTELYTVDDIVTVTVSVPGSYVGINSVLEFNNEYFVLLDSDGEDFELPAGKIEQNNYGDDEGTAYTGDFNKEYKFRVKKLPMNDEEFTFTFNGKVGVTSASSIMNDKAYKLDEVKANVTIFAPYIVEVSNDYVSGWYLINVYGTCENEELTYKFNGNYMYEVIHTAASSEDVDAYKLKGVNARSWVVKAEIDENNEVIELTKKKARELITVEEGTYTTIDVGYNVNKIRNSGDTVDINDAVSAYTVVFNPTADEVDVALMLAADVDGSKQAKIDDVIAITQNYSPEE